MICEKCGISYQGNYCPNGCNSPDFMKKRKKPFYQKWWFWVLIVLGVLVVLSAAVGSSGSEEAPESVTPSQSALEPQMESSQMATEFQQEPSQTETEIPETIPPDESYHVGDSIDANGLVLTYVSAEKWENYNEFMKPDPGKYYIRVLIQAKNTAKTDRVITIFDFDCYADGKKMNQAYFFDDSIEGGTLSSGRMDEGYLYFQVPAEAQKIEIEYETNFWTDKKAILKVEI